MNARVVLILLTAACACGAVAQPHAELEAKLKRQLLAPCCYRETVDHHMSDAAEAMRREIHQMVTAGKGEQEITNLYKQRYGAKVLAEPEGLTWWFGAGPPLAVFAVGAALVVRFVCGQARSNQAALSP